MQIYFEGEEGGETRISPSNTNFPVDPSLRAESRRCDSRITIQLRRPRGAERDSMSRSNVIRPRPFEMLGRYLPYHLAAAHRSRGPGALVSLTNAAERRPV